MASTKNRDLNDRERTYVCLKIKEFYDHRSGEFLHGGRQEVKKRCDRANIGVSIDTIRRYAREMRDQERVDLGCLSTYLLQVFFWVGVQLILNRGSSC